MRPLQPQRATFTTQTLNQHFMNEFLLFGGLGMPGNDLTTWILGRGNLQAGHADAVWWPELLLGQHGEPRFAGVAREVCRGVIKTVCKPFRKLYRDRFIIFLCVTN